MKVEITDRDSTEDEEIGEDFEVEQIVGMKINLGNKVIQFQVRWKGYEECDDYWLPIEDLSCDHLIEKFLDASGRRDEYMTAMLTKYSSNKHSRRAAMSEGDRKKNEASFVGSKRSERESGEAFLPKESKRRKLEPLSDDINIKTEIYEDHAILLNGHFDTLARTYDDKTTDPSVPLEDLLKKKSSSKDCRETPINNRDRKEDGASLGKTKRRNESGSDEAFSSEKFKRIKIDKLSDDINIKTETYEYRDELLNNCFDILPTKCDNGIEEPSLSEVCLTSNNTSNKLHACNAMHVALSHQKSNNKLAHENFPISQRVQTDQSRTSQGKNTARLDEDIFAPTKRIQLKNHDSFHSRKQNSLDESYSRSNDHATMKLILERLLSCELCSYATCRKDQLNQHILTHTGEKSLSCETCSYTTGYKGNLKRHILTHTGEKPFTCESCDYASCLKANLKQHLLTHTGEKPFSCEICSYATSLKGNLKQHISTHTGEKPFTCESCSYKTVNKSHLVEHIFIHTGEKPFSCEICSYATGRKGDLKQHISTHTGEKPFTCESCSYKTAKKSHLIKHIFTHTGEKPFSCEICSYATGRKGGLKQHILTHTREKPFSCKR